MPWKSILNRSVWKTESTYKLWSDYAPLLVTGLSPISYYRTEPEHEEAGALPLSPCTSSARVALEKQGLCLLGRERCAARAGGGPGCERCRPCGRGSRGGGGAGRERAGGRAGGRAGAGRGGPRPPAPFVRRPPSLSAGRPWLRGRRWARARGSAPGPRPPARAARRRSRGAKAQVAADGLGTRVCSLWARCGGWVSRTGAVAGVPRCDLGEGRGGSRPRSVREAQALYRHSGLPPTGTGRVFPHALARPSRRGPSLSLSCFPAQGQPSIPLWPKSVLASLPFIPPCYETGHYSKLCLRLLSVWRTILRLHKNEHPFIGAMSFSTRNHSGLLPYSSDTEQFLDNSLHTPGAMALASSCADITALHPVDLKSQSARSLWTRSHGMQCYHYFGLFKRLRCILPSRVPPLPDGCFSWVDYGGDPESKYQLKAFRASCWF